MPPTSLDSDDSSDLPNEVWQPTVEPVWWQRWSRGWRLVLVLAVVAAGYVFWRGPADYRAAKAWRGRGLAARAGAAAAAGKVDEAQRLLDQAGVLGPRDATVLRAIADFAEPREDVMAVYALRQLQATGQAEEADLQRLARLAFSWGRPELAPADALREWAAQPADGQELGRLEAGARWLAGQGLIAEAEGRLRRALDQTAAAGRTDDGRRLSLALARLLAADTGARPEPVRLEEAVARWLEVGRDVAATPRQVAEAMDSAVAAVRRGAGAGGMNGDLAAPLREIVAYRVDTAPAATRATLRLALAALDLHLSPLGVEGVVQDLTGEARLASDPDALRIARWLGQQGYHEEARKLADERLRVAPASVDWFVVRLNAWFARKQWEAVRDALLATDQPLPVIKRALFLYRLALSAEPEGPSRENERAALRESARTARAADVLEVAGNLEAAGDLPLAMEFYRQVQGHEQVGLAARLGLVRCLHRDLKNSTELIDSLQALLTLWPDSNEARGDLAYLRLLPPAPPRPDDIEGARRLAEEAPQFLAFRIVAALAALRDDRAEEALSLSGGDEVPWEQVRPGWRAVQACVLAANGRAEQARALAATVPTAALRSGELALLQKYSLSPST